MNRITLYILLVLIYLGLSIGFSTNKSNVVHIPHEYVLSHFFPGAPISVILEDSFQSGFIIKTFYQRYLVVHAFKRPYVKTVTTSKSFWKKNLNNKGMSLFHRDERTGKESLIPLPPGALYLGDPSFGYWENNEFGIKVWQFHRAYRNFPKIFGWDNFTPTEEFYERTYNSQEAQVPFYGLNNEFGTNGTILQSRLIQNSNKKLSFNKLLQRHFKNFTDLKPQKKR